MKASFPLWVAAVLMIARAGAAQTAAPVPVPVPAPAPAPAPAAATPPAATPAQPPSTPPPASAPAAPATPAAPVPSAAPAPPPSVPAPPPAASPGTPGLAIEAASLRLMREKGIISQAEYDSAIRDLTESTGQRAPEQGTVVLGKWATTLYGFVEADNIYDSTRSFNDLAGMAAVARTETQGGQNGRYTVGVRNSRIGFRLKAPAVGEVRTSAMLEMDFLGNQPPLFTQVTGGISEGAFFTNPTFRVRHFNFKVETPVVDFLVGQYWQLFGWQSVYQPNTVELQGVPGELYSRTPQVRISKTIKMSPLSVELAVAATRPVQRDSATPDGQGGIRIAVDSWTGVQTIGASGTTVSPFSIAATGLLRHVAVDNWAAKPNSTNDLGVSAFAVDAFLPLIPGTKAKKDNSFSLNGEYATGYGFADMYTGLGAGPSPTYPALPNPTNTSPAPTYTPDIDNGIVMYDNGGGLHGIQWTTMMVGAQYYLPGTDGTVWLSGNYSHSSSNNLGKYLTPTASTPIGKILPSVVDCEDWFDVNLFVDPAPAIRVGVEFADFDTMYLDSHHARNYRGQLSGFFIY